MTAVRVIIFLTLALVGSVGLNVHLYGQVRIAAARAQVTDAFATEVARAQGRADALAETHQRTVAFAEFAALDQQQLLRDLRALSDRSRQRVIVYRDRVQALPEAACAPGAERMDAVNALLGDAP